MTNTNCLEGIRCPACGSDDRFRIGGTSIFTVTDDGTEDHGDIEWDDGSYAACTRCGRAGTLGDFRAEDAHVAPGPGGNRPGAEEKRDRFEIAADPGPGGDRVHVRVDGKFDVAIIRTDEGVVVDIYPREGMEPVASTYAFDSEVEPE